MLRLVNSNRQLLRSATADSSVLLKTPYSEAAAQWILQAKLCVFFGDSVKEQRLGIRTI